MNVYIKADRTYSPIIKYVLKLIEKSKNLTFSFQNNPQNAHLIWDESAANSQTIAQNFHTQLANDPTKLNQKELFDTKLEIVDKKGQKDAIATIFYMVNSIQEWQPAPEDLDHYGRFKYHASYQARFNNITENVVQKEIDQFCKENGIVGRDAASTFFISHDIDTIFGSFLQDGFWAFKRFNIPLILKLITNEILRKPHWKNIDRILKVNSEKEIITTFFWLVNHGKGTRNIQNADYKLKKEQQLLKLVKDHGFVNGLHKSCSKMSMDEELEKGAVFAPYNRYHYLNFLPHTSWEKVEDSEVKFDCSLGFAEHYGFRNSYGKAFQPFDIKRMRPFTFVEAPLHFMDVSLDKYMHIPKEKIGDLIINFYEKNAVNCDLSLLWHNTYFSDYKYSGFLDEYKKVLAYLYEKKVECVTPKELINRNRIEW